MLHALSDELKRALGRRARPRGLIIATLAAEARGSIAIAGGGSGRRRCSADLVDELIVELEHEAGQRLHLSG